MSNKIIYKIREPIGSSTFPHPDSNYDADAFVNHLSMPSQSKLCNQSTLYVHIPFCDQICSFCGFNKYKSTEDRKSIYLDALYKEMKMYASFPYIKSLSFKAVYLGGGTPTSLSEEQIQNVLQWIHAFFNIDEDAEITCEGTPSSFTSNMISVLKSQRVTRVSAGIQTFNRELRETHLNLSEGRAELLNYINLIQNGFDNFNLDLIYNLPQQSDDVWLNDLKTILETKVTHLTLYPYVLLDKTRFYSQTVKVGKYALPTLERELDLFDKTIGYMQSTRMSNHYTIRDWAEPNKECRYVYLNSMSSPLLALGSGSFGYLAGFTYQNTRSLNQYNIQLLERDELPVSGVRRCSVEDEMRRFMVMGLRLGSLNLESFRELFGCDWKPLFGVLIDRMIDSGYLILKEQQISYTKEGLIWANNIRSEFEGSNSVNTVGYDTVSISNTGKSHYKEPSLTTS